MTLIRVSYKNDACFSLNASSATFLNKGISLKIKMLYSNIANNALPIIQRIPAIKDALVLTGNSPRNVMGDTLALR